MTFRLRDDGRWTNGDRVTAVDFEYAWKRVLDPKLAAVNASQLYGIVGADRVQRAARRAATKLRDRVGVKALDERTLEVRLTSPQPWFVGQVANVPFLPVHRATVERFGRKVDRAGEHRHERPLPPHRPDARRVDHADEVEAVAGCRRGEGRAVRGADHQGTRRLRSTAFEAGEIDACIVQACIPPDDIERLQDGDAYLPAPGLVTRYLGLNLKTVPDLNQRRALAFALDRTSLVENVTKADEEPADELHARRECPGFDAIAQHFLPKEADLEAARRYLERATAPKRTLNLVYSTSDRAGDRKSPSPCRRCGSRSAFGSTLHGLEVGAVLRTARTTDRDGSIDVFVSG